MKAQVAMEYMVIVSFALMVLIPFTIYLQTVSQNFSDDNALSIASNSVKNIGQAADWVHSQGVPAKLKVTILVPNNVQSIAFEGKTMTWKVRAGSGISDIYYTSAADLSGSMPTSPSYYDVFIQATENGVSVNVSPI